MTPSTGGGSTHTRTVDGQQKDSEDVLPNALTSGRRPSMGSHEWTDESANRLAAGRLMRQQGKSDPWDNWHEGDLV